MRILFLTNKAPYPPKDGGSIASFGMINAFAESGHQVCVMAMNTKKHHISPFDIPEEIKAKILFYLIEVPAKINTPDLLKNFVFSTLPYTAERFISKTYRRKLASLLQNQEFDIVQLEGLYLCPYIPTIRKYSKAIIAYRSHNIEHEIWNRTAANARGIKRLYLKNLTNRIKTFETKQLNRYDLLVSITQRDLEHLQELGNKKPAVSIPAGFDFTEDAEVDLGFEQNLFFIGALDWTPNQEGLIWFIDKCWPIILEKNPKAILKIAGRNAPVWLIEKFNQKNIAYLGEIESAKLYIQHNGIMIAPLLSGSGMRVKIIEGMLYQKAIVTTSIGCEGIDLTNKKEIYIADKPKKFVKYVLELLNDRQKVIEVGLNAYNFVKVKYDNKKLIEKLLDFYKQFM